MTNYFYIDAYGQKQGPYKDQQLKELAAQGIITPNTSLETDTGHKGMAGQIPGLFPPAQTTQATQLFCTNCGKPVSEQAVACMSCGAKPVGHRRFCRQCAAPLSPEQVVCVRCGAGIRTAVVPRPGGGVAVTGAKSKVVAGLLGIFLGGLGVHKFYMGSWGWGLIFVANPFLILPFTGFLSFLTMGLLFPLFMLSLMLAPVQGIIGLVEGIMYLVMSDEAFAEKYPAETQSPFRW